MVIFPDTAKFVSFPDSLFSLLTAEADLVSTPCYQGLSLGMREGTPKIVTVLTQDLLL